MQERIKCLSQVNKDQGCRDCTVTISIEKDIKSLNGNREDEIAVQSVISEWSKYCPEGMQPIIRNNGYSMNGGEGK